MTIKLDPRRFAKALVGPVLGLIGALVQWQLSGHLDQHVLIHVAEGIVIGIGTYFLPNAAPELQAAEAIFAPVYAGHPDPEPAVAPVPAPALTAVPEPAPATPPAAS